jgi:hypothetical protein
VFTSSGFLKVFPPDEQERLLFLAARQGWRARMSGSKPLIHRQAKPFATILLFFFLDKKEPTAPAGILSICG